MIYRCFAWAIAVEILFFSVAELDEATEKKDCNGKETTEKLKFQLVNKKGV